MDRLRVVVVGQTPPPHGGQALMIESFVTGRYERVEIVHVRMAFSDTMGEVGRVRLRKLLHLPALVLRILWARLRTGATILYYPPGGPELVPVSRDIAILLATRWAFRRTVFHFHAAGLADVYPRLPAVLRWAFRRAYGRPDLAITPSALNPPDGEFLDAARIAVVPCGIPDDVTPDCDPSPNESGAARLLYVGVVRESKGALVLAEACAELARRGFAFHLRLMGEFQPPAFEAEFRALVDRHGLGPQVSHLGVLTGEAKAQAFADADVFCYPTFFESESFGVVLLEAMRSELPVVATRWRGVPSIVDDGETGIVVDPHDSAAFADALAALLSDPEQARTMGRAGRARYLAEFTEERYRRRLEDAFVSVGASLSPRA